MARRIAGQRSESIFDLQRVGPASPIDPAALPPVHGADYVKLVSTWGGGWVYGTLEIADPRAPHLQRCCAEPLQSLLERHGLCHSSPLEQHVREVGPCQ